MPEYKQHLIGLAVKTGVNKERFHPYKKRRAAVEINVTTLPRVCSTNPCQHPSTWCNSPFAPIPKGHAEEVVVEAEVMATEATHPALSSSNLLNDIQTNVLDSSHLGQKQITVSETILVYCYPHAPPEGTPCFESLQEREKTPCVQSLQEKEKTPCIKTVLPVGGRLRHVLSQWEEQGTHRSILSQRRDGYRLPFRERPNLSRVPCITKLQRAIEVVHTQNQAITIGQS